MKEGTDRISVVALSSEFAKLPMVMATLKSSGAIDAQGESFMESWGHINVAAEVETEDNFGPTLRLVAGEETLDLYSRVPWRSVLGVVSAPYREGGPPRNLAAESTEGSGER
jgi:hypothetical protein